MSESKRAPESEPESAVGRYLALVVGIACFVAAVVTALAGEGIVVVTILALIGASALSGWIRDGRGRPSPKTEHGEGSHRQDTKRPGPTSDELR